MKIEQVRLTPELAERLLAMNTNNRPMNPKHIARLVDDMKSGNWKTNGDTIRIGNDTLLDGQHRCAAVVSSGVTIDVVLLSEIDADVFDTIDTGRKRTPGDMMAIAGEKSANQLAAACRWIVAIESRKSRNAVSTQFHVLQDALRRHPMLRESVDTLRRQKGPRIVAYSLSIALHCLMSEIDSEAADDFWQQLISGNSLDESSQLLVLRNRLVANLAAKAKVKDDDIAVMIIKTWNAIRSDKRMMVARAAKNEEFPTLT